MLWFKMKIAVVLCALISQSSASFYDKFTGALSTVKSSVGKLLTDVGHDLKETYDCTVDAVEEVFYDEEQISHYYDKCKQTTTTERTIVLPGQHINIYIAPIVTTTPKDYTPKEVTTQKPDATIVKIIHYDKDIDKKLEKVETVLNSEYSRVDNMSVHLEHEFVDLAQNVDKKLKIIAEDKVEVEKTLLEIEKLHIEEEKNIEKVKDEIRTAFDEILKKLNNNSKTEADLKNEVKDIIGQAEKNSSMTVLEELEKWKEKEMEELNKIKKAEEDNKRSTSTDRVPRSFKDVVALVSRETFTEPTTITKIESTTTTTPAIITTPTTESITTTISTTKPTTTTTTTVAVFTTTITTSTTEPTTTSTTEPTTTTMVPTTTTSTSAREPTTTTTTAPTTTTTTTIQPRTTTTISITQPTTTSTTEPTTTTSTTEPTTTSTSTREPTTTTTTTIQPRTTTTISTTQPTTTSTTEPTTTTSTTEPTTTSTSTRKPTTTTTTEPTTTTTTTQPTTTTTISTTQPTTSTTEPTTTTSTTDPTTTSTSTRKPTTTTTTEPTTTTTTTTTQPTTTTTSTTETPTTSTTTIKPKHHKKKKQHILTTIKPTLNDEFSDLEPKDPKAAADDALALFNKSKKTKLILDNFLSHLNAASGVLDLI